MKQYLVVFDKTRGHVSRLQEFDDRAAALRARFAAERQHAGDPNVEIVVLGADSRAALRQTHARYFETVGELVEAMAEKVARSA